MKKIVLITILSFLLLSYGIQVSAQEADLPSPGLLPDSPFYFLEMIAEEIGTFFTFGDLKKAERYAVLAAERLAEVKAVVEKGKPEFAEKTLARYENQLNNSIALAKKAQTKGQSTEQIMTRVGKATPVHLEVLAEVYEKVPEKAKPAIGSVVESAMKVSLKGHEKAVEALKAQDVLGEVPEEVPLPVKVSEEARERIQTRVQEELEVEKAEQAKENNSQSFESFKAFCIEQGAPPEMCESFVNDLKNLGLFGTFCAESGRLPPEMCEKMPPEGFKSFGQIEAFCMEVGGTLELCSSVEAKCREAGVTTPDECFLVLMTATTTTSAQPSSSE